MSNMKNHLAEFEEMKAELDVYRGIDELLDGLRRLPPFPLNFALLVAFHASVEWRLCWDEWRGR